MVLLTMTPAMVAAVEKRRELRGGSPEETLPSEPSLQEPAVGNPIAHAQVIEMARYLRQHDALLQSGETDAFHLSDLLRGSEVYIPPPKPKPEKTSEYKELMARLRREEEARAYARMVNPQSHAHQPYLNNTTTSKKMDGLNPNEDDDEMTFAEVQRQMTLIINVLVSIIACGIGIWLIASHWNAPSRLALSMGGGGVVGVAEVVIYAGYIRRLKEAKTRERRKVEKKTITETWVIDGSAKRAEQQPLTVPDEKQKSSSPASSSVRQRKAQKK